jgi:hypothetical protein
MAGPLKPGSNVKNKPYKSLTYGAFFRPRIELVLALSLRGHSVSVLFVSPVFTYVHFNDR